MGGSYFSLIPSCLIRLSKVLEEYFDLLIGRDDVENRQKHRFDPSGTKMQEMRLFRTNSILELYENSAKFQNEKLIDKKSR